MKNNLLSICIPTYNRKKILIDNLRRILAANIPEGINIYIFDDGDDGLEEDIVKLHDKLNIINYVKNSPRCGHDLNIFKALTYTHSKYVWLLGDSFYLNEVELKNIFTLLIGEQYDAIIVGSDNGRIKAQKTVDFNSSHDFFVDLGWHCTLTGVVIYKDEVIRRACVKINEINYRNFIQYALLFLGLNFDSKIHVVNSKVICKNIMRSGSYWLNNPFQVFAADWVAVNSSLSSFYGCSSAISVIRSHDLKTRLFSGFMLLYLKIHGGINSRNFSKLSAYERQAIVNKDSLYFKTILNIPDLIFSPFRYLLKYFISARNVWKRVAN